MAALDELEYTLTQLKMYIGSPLSPAEQMTALKLHDKALQKVAQARIQERERLLEKLDVLSNKLDMLIDVKWASLKEIQERERQAL